MTPLYVDYTQLDYTQLVAASVNSMIKNCHAGHICAHNCSSKSGSLEIFDSDNKLKVLGAQVKNCNSTFWCMCLNKLT